MRRLLLLGPLLAVAANATASAPAAEDWQISAHAPCAGLTLGWTPPLAQLAKLVGPGAHPAPGPVPGHGLLLIFATHCPNSRIGVHRTGPASVAAIIVPLQSAAVPGVDVAAAEHAAAIPLIEAPSASPVARLFARHAFSVRPAEVSLEVTAVGGGQRATLRIRSAHGDLRAEADFAAAPAPRNIAMSVLVNGAAPRLGVITGPESSSRYTTKTARISATGETALTRFGLHGAPALAALDTDFTWNFRFLPVRAR